VIEAEDQIAFRQGEHCRHYHRQDARINLCASDKMREATMNFPVSIKGVLVEAGRVVLLENERDEWELPGGRLEPGEAPETCLVREFAEELGAVVEVAHAVRGSA
jgi:8-oxo-dGTP pyrophosphatase MutT (NUDIX family)